MVRKYEKEYRLRENDDVLVRLKDVLRDIDLRVDAVELLGDAFAKGNRLDVDALVKSINNDFAQKSAQLAELLGELEDGLTPDRIIETEEKRFTSDTEITALQDATAAVATALANGLAQKLNSATFTAHRNDKSNPHAVTKAQVGLSKVEDFAPDEMPVSMPQADAIKERIRFFAAADPLPSADIGPIWHEAYASIMTWQVFDQNGADFEGYASVGVGTLIGDNQSTPRSGYLKASGLVLSKSTYAGLWNWALNSHRVAPSANYGAGNFMFGDKGDGTFIAPDVRGEFMRFLDDGRGINSGRTIGSWEDATYTRQGMNDYTDSDGVTADGNFLVGQSYAGADKVTGSTPGGAKTGSNANFSANYADNFTKANHDNNSGYSSLWISYRPRNFASLAAIKF